MHYHNCEEMVVVLEGEGECEIDGVVTPLKAQDAGYAPRACTTVTAIPAVAS